MFKSILRPFTATRMSFTMRHIPRNINRVLAMQESNDEFLDLRVNPVPFKDDNNILPELLRNLRDHYPDNHILFRGIKDASVAEGVLTLGVASQAIKERLEFSMNEDVVRIAKLVDPTVKELKCEWATVW